MKRTALFWYQVATGLSDTLTGLGLMIAPQFTLRQLSLNTPAQANPFVAYIGAFVLAVGVSCLYGVHLFRVKDSRAKLETVWLLTAFSRAAVCMYVFKAVLLGDLERPWLSVAIFDGVCALVQAIGLRKRWLSDVA